MGGLNFAITDTADYTGLDGAPGLYAFDAGSQTLWFSYGALDGQTARYNGSRSPHTITFLDAQNQLSDSCDLKA